MLGSFETFQSAASYSDIKGKVLPFVKKMEKKHISPYEKISYNHMKKTFFDQRRWLLLCTF